MNYFKVNNATRGSFTSHGNGAVFLALLESSMLLTNLFISIMLWIYLYEFPRCKFCRSSRQEVLWRKGVLKICSKFTGGHPCQSVISIKLLCNFIEIALRHECSPVNLLHIFRTPFLNTTSGWLLLVLLQWENKMHLFI